MSQLEELLEDLRTTVLWENISGYVESLEEAGKLLQAVSVNEKEPAVKA